MMYCREHRFALEHVFPHSSHGTLSALLMGMSKGRGESRHMRAICPFRLHNMYTIPPIRSPTSISISHLHTCRPPSPHAKLNTHPNVTDGFRSQTGSAELHLESAYLSQIHTSIKGRRNLLARLNSALPVLCGTKGFAPVPNLTGGGGPVFCGTSGCIAG